MIELELLGANGDTVVMTDDGGERYSIVVDDALRAAVRLPLVRAEADDVAALRSVLDDCGLL